MAGATTIPAVTATSGPRSIVCESSLRFRRFDEVCVADILVRGPYTGFRLKKAPWREYFGVQRRPRHITRRTDRTIADSGRNVYGFICSLTANAIDWDQFIQKPCKSPANVLHCSLQPPFTPAALPQLDTLRPMNTVCPSCAHYPNHAERAAALPAQPCRIRQLAESVHLPHYRQSPFFVRLRSSRIV